jgi:hypothetical protein
VADGFETGGVDVLIGRYSDTDAVHEGSRPTRETVEPPLLLARLFVEDGFEMMPAAGSIEYGFDQEYSAGPVRWRQDNHAFARDEIGSGLRPRLREEPAASPGEQRITRFIPHRSGSGDFELTGDIPQPDLPAQRGTAGDNRFCPPFNPNPMSQQAAEGHGGDSPGERQT